MSLRNLIFLPVALFSLALLVACGGSGTNHPVPPPSGAFSNTNFDGNYTFSVVGSDSNGFALAMAGTLDACGCSAGTISSGTVDIADPSGDDPAATIGSPSSYSISSDGRGTARLFITAGGVALPEIDMDFVLNSSSHGQIIRYDGSGSGSGTIDAQVSGASLGASSYAYSLSGSDFSENPLATNGAFTLDSNGNILTSGATAGIADFVYGFPSNINYQGVALSGNVQAGSGTTPGVATMDSAFGNLTFDVYPIDSNHAKLIEADGNYILVGDIFSSTSPSMPASNVVFSGSGVDSTGVPFATGGIVNSDGASQLTSGLQDVNDGGLVDGGGSTVSPSSFSGSFVESPVGSGRFVLTMSNFFGGTVFAAYPTNSGILYIETDTTANAGITSGVMWPQSSGAGIIASQGYGMNFTGLDISDVVDNGEIQLDEIAQFNATSTTAFTGLVDVNDGGSTGTSNFVGTLTPNSDGTGSAVLNSNPALGGFFYYAASTTAVPFISTDSTDVGVGMLQGQSSPSSASADVVSRHLAMMKAIPSSKKMAKTRKAHFAAGPALSKSK
jgi:hypothetical protein